MSRGRRGRERKGPNDKLFLEETRRGKSAKEQGATGRSIYRWAGSKNGGASKKKTLPKEEPSKKGLNPPAFEN